MAQRLTERSRHTCPLCERETAGRLVTDGDRIAFHCSACCKRHTIGTMIAPAPRCVACGELADICHGHGLFSGAYAGDIIAAHDDGQHERCHPAACDGAADALAAEALAILTADRCTVHGIARCTICHAVTR